MLKEMPGNSGRYLTSQETVELARIQQDSTVAGYAILTLDGDEIESGGLWNALLAPVFANVFDLADQLGENFGEEDLCPMVFMESPDFEIAGILLTSAKAVIIKRKQKKMAEGLRSVS